MTKRIKICAGYLFLGGEIRYNFILASFLCGALTSIAFRPKEDDSCNAPQYSLRMRRLLADARVFCRACRDCNRTPSRGKTDSADLVIPGAGFCCLLPPGLS